MISDEAKIGENIDFSDSKVWQDIAKIAFKDIEYESDYTFHEMIDRLIGEKQNEHLTGGLTLGFKVGSREANKFWQREREALSQKLFPEYEDLKEKIARGVFKVKPIAEKKKGIGSMIKALVFGAENNSQVMPEAIQESKVLPKLRINQRNLSTVATTSSTDSQLDMPLNSVSKNKQKAFSSR